MNTTVYGYDIRPSKTHGVRKIKSPGLTRLDFAAPASVIRSFVDLMYFEPITASPILIQFTPSEESVVNARIGLGEAPLSTTQSSPIETRE